MAKFSVTNSTANGGGAQTTTTTTYKSAIIIGNSTSQTANQAQSGYPRRGKLYDILVGTNTTPADNYMEYDVARITWGASSYTNTGGAVMISSVSSTWALDLADAGCVNIVSVNSSIETYQTSPTEIWYVGVNQRASYRWVAAPGSELVWPANSSGTAPNAIALRARSGGSVTVTGNVLFEEQ